MGSRDFLNNQGMDKIDLLRLRYQRRAKRGVRRARKDTCEVIMCGDRGHVHRCTEVAVREPLPDGHRVCERHRTEARHAAVFTVEDAREYRASARRSKGERLVLTHARPTE